MCPCRAGVAKAAEPRPGPRGINGWGTMSFTRRGLKRVWLPGVAIPAPNAPAVAEAEDADKDPDAVASEATLSCGTTVFGDSTYTDDEEATGWGGARCRVG